MSHRKVVILGGGFGGLSAAKKLGNTQFDICVIDQTNHHLFQPLLYQVASSALSPEDIAVPIREVLASYQKITVLMNKVVAIDKEQGQVVLCNGDHLGFEYLIIALGAQHSYFGKETWESFAPGLKTIQDALNIRERILMAFENAERCNSISEAKQYLNFVIVGGGPTGVEMAGAIAEMAHGGLSQSFRKVDTRKTKIYLIEGASRILPLYPEKLSEKARQALESFGVQVITGSSVTQITDEGVSVANSLIPSKTILWAAGNQAPAVLKTLNTPLDRMGRVQVDADLSIPGYPHIFVIGDSACALNRKGIPLPLLAPVAIQQGHYVARILSQQLQKNERPPFIYLDRGNLATIGRTKAVGMIGPVQLSGFFAWLIWGGVHILYLINFRNRFLVGLNWFAAYLSNKKRARLIYRSIKDHTIYHNYL